MSPEQDCIFCKIARGELPAAKVMENAALTAFLDIHPVAPGHVVLITKNHYASLFEAPESAARDLGATLPRLARAIRQGVGSPAINVVVNAGREAGQIVEHVHFHLIPRREGDRLFGSWPHTAYDEGEQEQVRQRIEAALRDS